MRRSTFYARYGKRMLDVLLAATALLIFAPVLLIVALLVRVKLGSPVLFRQRRPGKDGAIIDLVKFRTMTDARDAQGNLLSDEQRLTRFGKLLRGTSLDELPELLNILRGDMSVVGPRPLLVQYLPYYTPREQTRHDVRPGLTGWAQINGRVNVSWDAGLEMDAWYVENMSLWLDIKIIWWTFWKVIRSDDVHHHAGERPNLEQERRLQNAPAPAVAATSAGDITILSVEESDAWQAALAKLPHDVYHLPEYHRIAQNRGEGRARLWVFREGEYTIALPLLLRPLEAEGWLANGDRHWQDGTSVYGYAGPLASHETIPSDVLRRFHQSLTASLRSERIVTLFSRLHPLMQQVPLLQGLGDCAAVGRTVSIDLTCAPADLERQYSQNHRRDIKQLRTDGVRVQIDESLAHIDDFIAIYQETMRRVQASSSYFFDLDYFESLLRGMKDHCQLHVVLLGDKMIAGGLMFACGSILQYHLGGTSGQYLEMSPTKLLIAEVAAWGQRQGYRRLHLGGGKGSKQDSLYRFKAGFSDDSHDFMTWRWVLDAPQYQRLCDLKQRWNGSQGLRMTSPEYFPAFRSPVEAASS